tara:strand:+ start:168 stop:1196 length:1029 start_codon:yes stop_codon:yes gene_type:complete
MFWIQAIHLRYTRADVPKNIPYFEWASIWYMHVPEACIAINHAKLWVQRERGKRAGIIKPEKSDHTYGWLLSESAARYQATNPKDYIYGFAAVTGVRLQPDYSSETTVAQVYQDYVAEWFRTCVGGPEKDNRVQYSCDLWFLQLAGSGFSAEKLAHLPSWTPSFAAVAMSLNVAEEGSRLAPKMGTSDRGVFPDGVPTPKIVGSQLHCTALFVGQVTDVGPLILTRASLHDRSLESDQWLLWLFDCATKPGPIFKDSQSLLHAMIRAMCHRSSPDDLEQRFEQSCPLVLAEMEHVCATRRSMANSEFLEKLGLREPKNTVQVRDLCYGVRQILAFGPSATAG